MLTVTVPEVECWDDKTERFFIDPKYPPVTLKLEHSLRSVADWESKWKKPFIDTELHGEEIRDYVRFMTLNSADVPDNVYSRLGGAELRQIQKYINDPYTATTFRKSPWAKEISNRRPKNRGPFITAELIYYWMVMCDIPFEADTWNLNRLMTLIRICNEKKAPREKMTKRELSSKYASLNAQRLAATGGRG